MYTQYKYSGNARQLSYWGSTKPMNSELITKVPYIRLIRILIPIHMQLPRMKPLKLHIHLLNKWHQTLIYSVHTNWINIFLN